MPSGHPKDPVAFHAKMTAAREARAAKKQEDIDKAKQLAVRGYTNSSIADEMGIDESSVRALLTTTPVRKHTTSKRTAKKLIVKKAVAKERTYKDDNPKMFSREELNAELNRYGHAIGDLESKVEQATVRAEQSEERAENAERRLMTLLDLVSKVGLL
jgi:2-C-methyl-D-erythritol 4-phosphate cytidylyltransferase